MADEKPVLETDYGSLQTKSGINAYSSSVFRCSIFTGENQYYPCHLHGLKDSGSAAAASPTNLLKMQILGSHSW